MSVFALLIKYLFIVFILVAFFVIGVVAYFLHRVRNAARRFANGGMGGQGGMNNGMGRGRSSAANNGTYGSRAISTIRVRLVKLTARYSQRTKANTLTLWKNKGNTYIYKG